MKTNEIVELAKLNKPIFITAFTVSVLSSALFAINTYAPQVNKTFELSSATPWGVFTAIFIHSDSTHLLSNLVFLWVWIALIIFPDSLLNPVQTKHRISYFIPIVFSAAVLANIIWIIARPDTYSRGASGLVFAFGGIALGYIIMNLRGLDRLKDGSLNMKRRIGWIITNVMPGALLVILPTFYAPVFLGVGPGVNSFAHAVGFFSGMAGAMIVESVPSVRKSLKV